MKITAVHEGALPISSSIRNAWIDFGQMDCSIVAVVSDQVRDGHPVVGYGFNSNGRYSQGEIIRKRLVPRLLGADPDDLLDDSGGLDPGRAWDVMMRNEKPGGHGERSVAVGVIDMALWDLAAKLADVPLWRLVADRHGDGDPDPSVAVYAAGGYYQPGKGLPELQDEMRGFLDAGYTRVKMKIAGADLPTDLRRIEAVLEVVGDGSRLAVDANGRLDRSEAIRYGEAISPYGLAWYEEPSDPLDYATHAAISAGYDGPLATGENLFSVQDARNLIRYGGMRPDRDILQFDPALSYGLVEYLRTVDMIRRHGWSPRSCLPHGGHQFAVHIAAALKLGGNESYPNEFQPAGGFADDAQIVDGRLAAPDAPGIGIERKAELYRAMRALHS
ncbi:MAG TPA: mandelate racemase/muconate lactonizing enzyme family protein [Acidimicrobiales bacterium]|nr:mandelate racemase/muconate lactonizing enzyme family protein [Acidimicrobiales bacterium]